MNIKIEEDLKKDVDDILYQLGLSSTDAIRMFFFKIKAVNGIPFSLKVDKEINFDDLNEETKQAIIDCEKNTNKRKNIIQQKIC